jgi:aminoglycoside phosphotransferase (APT) family kinase protein
VDRLDRHDEGTNGSALLHGDYHPGNLIWRGPELAAVIDFEALGTGPCAQELASAALLFSLETPGRSPEAWPESPDIPRLTAFTAGYAESMAEARADIESVLDPAAQPWWMIHGLIAQAVPRACRLDGFGRHEMSEVVPFIARISAWIRDHADGLALVLADELASGHRPGG